MKLSGYKYCITCGGTYGDDIATELEHNCVNGNNVEQWCGHCGAELNDNGSCDEPHDEDEEEPEAPTPGDLKSILTAVLHQMEHGEASDVFDIGIINEDTQRDLRWCRKWIKEAVKLVSL